MAASGWGDWWDDPPPQSGGYYDDYFPPADTGTIIGNTPGVGWPDLGGPDIFRGDPTYGNTPTPPTPPSYFPPANTGDIVGNTPGVSGRDLGGAPFNWGKLGRNLLNIFGPGQGRPGQGQGQGVLPAIARILQGLSQGRAQGRMTEAEMARLYDYLNLARTRTFYDRAGQELDQRKFGQDLQERSFRNATRASLLQNFAPTPTGRAPAAITPFMGTGPERGIGAIPQGTRDEIGGAMYRNAITELLDPLQPGTATSGRRMAELPVPDPISPTPESGTFDDVLNWASIIMGGLYPTQTTTTTTPTPTPTPRPAEPPAPVEPRRSTTTSSVTPGMAVSGQPFRELPRATSPSLPSLSQPTPASQYSTPPSVLANQPTGITNRLPEIASLVPEVPGPTAPLGSGQPRISGQPFRQLEYDEYGRPIRGGR